MMIPEFKRWLGEMCMFYTRPNWPTEENVTQAFRDVRHMDGQALEFLGTYIRTKYEEWPKSISAVMVKGYELWQIQQAEEAKRREREASTYVPPTPEQAARRQAKCREIMESLRTGVRPPWAGEPRRNCCAPDTDSYHRGRRG